MIATHHIDKIFFNDSMMTLNIDGEEFQFELSKVSNKLFQATEMERSLYKISPSGYGIHWPLIDEDLSVDALLKSKIG
ncbi:MAG: DUF2442 domain-containing protein [Bacteroidetes bacterium]|nr:DUF2442 domain-containing protein [Bacteroidota bacterium]